MLVNMLCTRIPNSVASPQKLFKIHTQRLKVFIIKWRSFCNAVHVLILWVKFSCFWLARKFVGY